MSISFSYFKLPRTVKFKSRNRAFICVVESNHRCSMGMALPPPASTRSRWRSWKAEIRVLGGGRPC